MYEKKKKKLPPLNHSMFEIQRLQIIEHHYLITKCIELQGHLNFQKINYICICTHFIDYRYVKCKFSKDPSTPCRVRGKLVDNHVVLSQRHPHTCDPTEALIQFRAFKDALFEAIQTDARRTAFQVYESVAHR